MRELIGVMPKEISLSGHRSRKFFNRAGRLKNLREPSFWPLNRLLNEKYHFNEQEANEFADFFGSPLKLCSLEAAHSNKLPLASMAKRCTYAPEPYVEDQNESDFQRSETSK